MFGNEVKCTGIRINRLKGACLSNTVMISCWIGPKKNIARVIKMLKCNKLYRWQMDENTLGQCAAILCLFLAFSPNSVCFPCLRVADCSHCRLPPKSRLWPNFLLCFRSHFPFLSTQKLDQTPQLVENFSEIKKPKVAIEEKLFTILFCLMSGSFCWKIARVGFVDVSA